MNSILIGALLIAATAGVGCTVSQPLPEGSVPTLDDVSANLAIRDTQNGGVIARISIRNGFRQAICVPSRYLGLEPWPFVVTDEKDQRVMAKRIVEDDAFGGQLESFFVVGSGKTLVKELPLGGSIDLPQGTQFKFAWLGIAYACDDVAQVLGFANKLALLSQAQLRAEAILPR